MGKASVSAKQELRDQRRWKPEAKAEGNSGSELKGELRKKEVQKTEKLNLGRLREN